MLKIDGRSGATYGTYDASVCSTEVASVVVPGSEFVEPARSDGDRGGEDPVSLAIIDLTVCQGWILAIMVNPEWVLTTS